MSERDWTTETFTSVLDFKLYRLWLKEEVTVQTVRYEIELIPKVVDETVRSILRIKEKDRV